MKSVCVALFLVLAVGGVGRSDEISFAIYPMTNPEALTPPLEALCSYLSENTGHSFVPVITRDYDQMVRRLKEGSVHLAWLNSSSYVALKKSAPSLRYVATYAERNAVSGEILPYYQSVIITLKTSGIADLASAKGTRFAFTDFQSTSGYAYPLRLLQTQGIDPRTYFRKVFFLKRHDRVIEALVRGSVDLGAVSDGMYHAAVSRQGDIFRILATSEPIPLDAIVASERMDEELVVLCRQLLCAVLEDHPAMLSVREHLGWPGAGFVVRDDDFYNSAREVLP